VSAERPTPNPITGTATASRYDILARLAIGGMAEIFIARATTGAGVQRHVVLKRILPERSRDPQFVAMFLREAHFAAQLRHPNIAQVHDIGKLGGSYFFTMEYVHGETVRRLLGRVAAHRRSIPLPHVLTIIAGAAAGLHHAHERCGPDRKSLGLVHCDVSPSNLMVTFEGTVKLVDFGVAKASSAETKTGGIKGKISYLSPEQCRGRKDVDRRSDLFSLGIVFHEMLTAARLFRRETEFESMSAIVHNDTAPPSKQRPEIPPELDALVLRLLAKKPADRFATAADLLQAVEALAARLGLPLSPSALGRYICELFGDRPEPWLELESEHGGRVVTVTTDVMEPIGELDSIPSAVAESIEPDLAEVFAADVPTVPEHQLGTSADDPFAPDPRPARDLPPIASTSSFSDSGSAAPPLTDTDRDVADEPRSVRVPAAARRRRRHVGWLIAALVTTAVGGALVVIQGQRASSSSRTPSAVEDDGKQLGQVLDSVASAAQIRASGIATTPMMRAAIETDRATLEDILRSETLLAVKPGEVLEVFQTRDGDTVSLLRVPEAAAPIALPADHAPALVTDGSQVTLIASAPIAAARSGVGGAIAISVPVDLEPIKQQLAKHTVDATLVGLDRPVRLAGTESATGGGSTTMTLASGVGAPVALHARFPIPEPDNTLRLLGFAGFAFGAALLVVYLRLARQPRPP
jgi:serine/threonine protein kinase